MWLFRGPLVGFFLKYSGPVAAAGRLGDQILRVGARVMIFAAIFQLFDAMGIVFIGALRGAGATRWPMCITIALNWTVAIGGGILAVNFAPGLKSAGPWLAGTAFVICLGVLLAWRFESGAWRKIDLLGKGPSDQR